MSQDINVIQLKEKVESLQQAILAAHPTIPILLRDIHKQLKEDPACVTILSEDEIATIISGLKQQTKTEITQAALKKRVTKGNISLDDL